MRELPSVIMRYGVIAGLALTLVGTVVKYILGDSTLVMLGLMAVVMTPIASLAAISADLASSKDKHGFALSLLAIATILASIALSLSR